MVGRQDYSTSVWKDLGRQGRLTDNTLLGLILELQVGNVVYFFTGSENYCFKQLQRIYVRNYTSGKSMKIFNRLQLCINIY